MLSEARRKKIVEKLNRAQKCSILGPQNLGSRGGPDPRGPPGSAPGCRNEMPVRCGIYSSPANAIILVISAYAASHLKFLEQLVQLFCALNFMSGLRNRDNF